MSHVPGIVFLSRYVPQACNANTVRGELPTESQGSVPRQPSASELQEKLKAANVRKVDFLEPSVFVQARPPHVHGTYACMNSVARTQHLGSTNNGDKLWPVAPNSGAINTGRAPEEAYGRLASQPHLPAPPLMPIFNEAASRRYGPGTSTAAIQAAPSVYGDRLRWDVVKVARLDSMGSFRIGFTLFGVNGQRLAATIPKIDAW